MRAKVVTVMRWYAQDEVNQEDSEQNEVDGMKKGADRETCTNRPKQRYDNVVWDIITWRVLEERSRIERRWRLRVTIRTSYQLTVRVQHSLPLNRPSSSPSLHTVTIVKMKTNDIETAGGSFLRTKYIKARTSKQGTGLLADRGNR